MFHRVASRLFRMWQPLINRVTVWTAVGIAVLVPVEQEWKSRPCRSGLIWSPPPIKPPWCKGLIFSWKTLTLKLKGCTGCMQPCFATRVEMKKVWARRWTHGLQCVIDMRWKFRWVCSVVWSKDAGEDPHFYLLGTSFYLVFTVCKNITSKGKKGDFFLIGKKL